MIKAYKRDDQSNIIDAMGICCPVCGDTYVHFVDTPEYKLQSVNIDDWPIAGPILPIEFWSECGSGFVLMIGFHKGQMFLHGKTVKSCRLDYHEYIQSDEWKIKASAAKQNAGWRCQVCNKSHHEAQLDAHHRTYERLGHELPGDITVLCRDCHELYERNKKARKAQR